MLYYIKQYFDMLNNAETEIYSESDYYVVNNSKKYILFLNDLKPALIYKLISHVILFIFIVIALNLYVSNWVEEYLIPSFILNIPQYRLWMEDLRSKKIWVLSIMFFCYNLIYSSLCQSSSIHIYQNRDLIFNNPFNERVFTYQMNIALEPI